MPQSSLLDSFQALLPQPVHPAAPGAARPPIATRILTDLADALRLITRHNCLNRSVPIWRALRAFFDGNLVPLQMLRLVIPTRGAYLDDLSVQEMIRRLLDPLYLTVESWTAIDGTVFGGDCQFRLPADRPDAKLVVDLPGIGDVHTNTGIIADMLRNPAEVAYIEGVCADDAVARWGYAKAAKVAAFAHIRALNKTRTYPIRFAIGELFHIRGLKLATGRSLLLGGEPLVNGASKTFNADSDKVGVLRDHTVDVPGTNDLLLVDWEVRAHRIDAVPATQT
jgi:hypothetical protein